MPASAEIAKQMSPKGWAMVGGSAAAGLVFLVIVMQMASEPSYSTLETGLDPSQTGKITSTLDTQGIAYQLQNNGTALAVQSGQTAQARVALATAGLLGNQQPGFSLIDNQQLGPEQLPAADHLRARARGPARVDDPDDQRRLLGPGQPRAAQRPGSAVLRPARQPATAVGAAVGLEHAATRARCAASRSWSPPASPACSLSKVTITGSDGSLLWPTGNGSATAAACRLQAGGRPAATTPRWPRQVNAMLAQTLGAGKAQVHRQRRRQRQPGHLRHARLRQEGRAPDQQSQTETLKGGGARRRRRRGHRGQHPRLRGGRRRRRQLQLQATRPPTPSSASTRRSPTR